MMGCAAPFGAAPLLVGIVLQAVRVAGPSRRLAGEGQPGLGLAESHHEKQEQPARHMPHSKQPNRAAGPDRETLMRGPSHV